MHVSSTVTYLEVKNNTVTLGNNLTSEYTNRTMFVGRIKPPATISKMCSILNDTKQTIETV